MKAYTPFKMKPFTSPKGYLRIQLDKKGVKNKHLLHRVVLLAFVGEDKERPQCDHINNIKSDNRLSNLRWVTAHENVMHRSDTGGYHTTEGKVLDIAKVTKIYEAAGTSKEISSRLGVNFNSVKSIRAGVNWSHITSNLVRGKTGRLKK